MFDSEGGIAGGTSCCGTMPSCGREHAAGHCKEQRLVSYCDCACFLRLRGCLRLVLADAASGIRMTANARKNLPQQTDDVVLEMDADDNKYAKRPVSERIARAVR